MNVLFNAQHFHDREIMKRARASEEPPATKKRKVGYSTYQKWRRDFDGEYGTITWLACETEMSQGKRVAVRLNCSVCTKYNERIMGRRNYSNSWIVGAESIRTSNIRDHTKSDQHCHAMSLRLREQATARGECSSSYAPIAAALTTMSDEDRAILRRKFDITYVMAREKLSFRKFPAFCELETRHGVNLGSAYKTETSAKTFTHFIAESQRQELVHALNSTNFFSILLDGSTDAGNIDNELLLVMWFDKEGKGEKVCTRISYFTVTRPASVSAQGLFDTLGGAMKSLGISAITQEACSKLVGVGTDGASANIARRGLKGLVAEKLPWVFWMWCLAHRLELAIKDALKATSFSVIDEMLLRLYFIYEKSPKKCRQLEEIIADLKECLSLTVDDGIRPVRACGSRWIGHKWGAMKRVISKYGAYTTHLTALSEDTSLRSEDRCKLKGYCRKWVNAKYLLGCALFCDLLSPCVALSKIMQCDELDIVQALAAHLRVVKETEKLSAKNLDDWPTYASTLGRCVDEDGTVVYQCQEVKNFSSTKSFYTSHYKEYCSKVLDCIKSRLSWSDAQQLRDIIFVLASQGWQKAVEEEDSLEAIDRLVEQFSIPLESAGADISAIHGEFQELLQYATTYVSISTIEYHAVWWRLFHASCASEWVNVLTLAELLFSLPASNGKLERVFSQVNIIKSNRRTSLTNETLDDLVMISTMDTPLAEFNPDKAIDLWWREKTRRPNQTTRKQYKKNHLTDISDSDSDLEMPQLLDDWDRWIASDTGSP